MLHCPGFTKTLAKVLIKFSFDGVLSSNCPSVISDQVSIVYVRFLIYFSSARDQWITQY